MNYRKWIGMLEWIGIILMLIFMLTVVFCISFSRETNDDNNDLYEYLLDGE